MKTMLEPAPVSDAQLVERSRGGDREAFGRIVTRFQGLIGAVVTQEMIATHFDLTGRPNGWMSRTGYAVFMVVITVGVPLFIIGITWAARFLPTSMVNVPHREYWLAPERRAATLDYMFRHMLWLAALLVLFFAGIHLSVVDANQHVPPRLSMLQFWTLLGGFLAGVAVWTAILYRHFRRPR